MGGGSQVDSHVVHLQAKKTNIRFLCYIEAKRINITKRPSIPQLEKWSGIEMRTIPFGV